MISKITTLSATAALAGAVQVKSKSKCPFGYGASDDKPESAELAQVDNDSGFDYPSQILTCAAGRIGKTASLTKAQYMELAQDIISQQFGHGGDDEASKYAACFLRLEGHDLMDFRRINKKNRKGKIKPGQAKLSGGSDGCINFHDEDNTGLPQCMQWSNIVEVYEKWCDKVSMADFMVIAAEASTGSIAHDRDMNDPWKVGGLLQMYRDNFKFGRETLETCPDNVGLMPNPEMGCNHLKDIFIDNIYNTDWNKKTAWARTAAISGAHTIGFAKPENSGYDGFWGDRHNQNIFNNDYFRNIMAHGWGADLAVKSPKHPEGNPAKNQWKIVDEFGSFQEGKVRQMMLDSDMCLYYTHNRPLADCLRGNGRVKRLCEKFKKGAQYRALIHAKTSAGCCAWTGKGILQKAGVVGTPEQGFCGLEKTGGEAGGEYLLELGGKSNIPYNQGIDCPTCQAREDIKDDRQRAACCVEIANEDPDYEDCDSYCAKGPAHEAMWKMAGSNQVFFEKYLDAWNIATENGWTLTALLD